MLHLPSPIPFHDLFFIILHSVVDSAAIITNLILLFAIAFRSPSSLRSYAVLLANAVIVDLIAAAASVSIMIRLIPVHDMMAYVYVGPCSAVSGFFCQCLFIVSLATFAQSLFLNAMSFGFRLHVLDRKNPPPPLILIACMAVYVPSIAALMPFLFSVDDVDAVRRALAVAKPAYDMDSYVIQGHLTIYKWPVLFAIGAITIPSVPLLVFVFVLRAKVLAKIREKSSQLSSKTMRMHSTLAKVLSLQAILPVFFLLGVVNYFLCQLNVIECSIMQEHLMMQTVSFTLLIAPAITLHYVQPYREFLLNIIRCGLRYKPSTLANNPTE